MIKFYLKSNRIDYITTRKKYNQKSVVEEVKVKFRKKTT